MVNRCVAYAGSKPDGAGRSGAVSPVGGTGPWPESDHVDTAIGLLTQCIDRRQSGASERRQGHLRLVRISLDLSDGLLGDLGV